MEHCPNFYLCKPCIYNKMKKTFHRNSAKRADYPIKYIYTDIVRLLLAVSYDGFCY